MANREQHSNRQTKKPKKVKPQSAPATPASVWASIEKGRAGPDTKK